MQYALKPHPETSCPAVHRITVEVDRTGPHSLALRYSLVGDLAILAIPAAAAAERAEELWNHTCFEAFADIGGDAYLEFNFSPSSEWAAYRFDAYRKGKTPLDGIVPPQIETVATDGVLEVRVALTVPVKTPMHLGLTTVIEVVGGGPSYWALAHPSGRPDFHHPDGRILTL